MKQKPTPYNDGFLKVYRRKKENLTANRNVTNLDELDFVIKLAFEELSRRQQDLEFAEQNSFSLSLKVKTPKPMAKKGIDTNCYAVMEDILYGIRFIDTNSTEYYFYLEKVRKLEGISDES